MICLKMSNIKILNCFTGLYWKVEEKTGHPAATGDSVKSGTVYLVQWLVKYEDRKMIIQIWRHFQFQKLNLQHSSKKI